MRVKQWVLNTIFQWCSPKDFDGINEEQMNEWLVSLQRNDGFKAYYKYRYLQIMKTLAGGVDQEEYWKLVGRRKELLTLSGESRFRDDLQQKDKKEIKKQTYDGSRKRT